MTQTAKIIPPTLIYIFYFVSPHYVLMANQIKRVLMFCLSGCADFVVEIRILYLSNILPLIISPVLP